MVFIISSRRRTVASNAARAALEAAVAALLAGGGAALVWRAPADRLGIVVGVFVAWLASSVSAGALMAAKERSTEAFWWAFGAGMALRFAALLALMVVTVFDKSLSAEALLLSYSFGVLSCLLIEYRRIRLK